MVNELPKLGFGLGLRSEHYNEILATEPKIDWFEALTENYLGREDSGSGRPLKMLVKIRERFPVVLHGVSLSIGSTDSLNLKYLKRVKELRDIVEPEWISDHLCWTSFGGHNSHDLLPLPYTEEALEHVIERVKQVQDFFGHRILLENVSSYAEFRQGEFTEAEFLREVAVGANCGILLDVNNIFVSAVNHEFNPLDYLKAIPSDRVAQIHLAGHTNKGRYLIDTHDHPVVEPVWDLYAEAIRRFGNVATMIEWDDQIPALSRLVEELDKARRVQSEVQDAAA